MAKLKTFLTWVGAKKGRWKIALFSFVVLILTIGVVIFLILSGYDKDKGFYKEPVHVELKKGATE